MKRTVLGAAMVLAVGCNASVGGAQNDGTGDDDSSAIDLDASTAIDAAPDADLDAPLDAALVAPDAPRCSESVVWLQFDGITLTRTAISDATQHRASWLGAATVTVPPYLAADPDRATKIDLVAERVRTALATFPLQVVTMQPLTGKYVMIAFGGTQNDVGTTYSYAVNALDCGDTVPNDVGWVSDVVPLDKVDDYAVGAIGYGLGLTGTFDTSDCMCGWGSQCNQTDTQCTLHADATAQVQCTNQVNPQNEPAAYEAAFCTP